MAELLESETLSFLPRVLPDGWEKNPETHDAFHHRRGFTVILNVLRYDDGKKWAHFSMSRRDRKIPSWDELRWAKEIFLGKNRKAIQVLPPESEYVNHHPGVLHLFACLDDDGLPDFRVGGTL